MKSILAAMIAMFVLVLPATAADKKNKEESGATKMTLVNFSKGDTFNVAYADISLVEEHLTGKEKARLKVVPRKEKTDYNGSVGIQGMSKGVDWSKANYLVFNCFVEGNKPWSGQMLIGDKASYEKWAQNYASVPLTMKPGENKEFHVGIEGLFAPNAKRALDMTCIQVFEFFVENPPSPTIYLGNIYLVKEEE